MIDVQVIRNVEVGWGFGVGLTTPSRKIYCCETSRSLWRRPRPTQGCGASKEEEEKMLVGVFIAAFNIGVQFCNLVGIKPLKLYSG
jgi:hypothetical protein